MSDRKELAAWMRKWANDLCNEVVEEKILRAADLLDPPARGRTVRVRLCVAVDAAEWPDGVVPPPPPVVDLRLRLGVACGKCGADDWRQARNRSCVPAWRVCRPCENAKAVRNQRRARAALAGRAR